MEKSKQPENLAGLWLVLLFFGAVALIAAGLWQLIPALALIFLGLVLLYVGVCLNRVTNKTAGKENAK